MTTQTEALKRFLIQTSVENAEGSQTWYVDAENEAEALQKYNNGECDMYANEAEVTSLGQPELAGETTLDDFGDFNDKPLAQPEQEPLTGGDERRHIICLCPDCTSPPQRTWVGLTDEDRYEFAAAQYGWEDLLIAAEAKLKEKNGIKE